MVFTCIVGLTTSTDSTTAFTAAFCLETIVFSHQLWVKLSVGIVLILVTVILLASWCVGIVIEAKNFSVRRATDQLKDQLVDFFGSFGGKTSGSDNVGAVEVEMAEGEREALPPGCLKKAFSVFRRGRGILTPQTPVCANPLVNEGAHQPGSVRTGVEMSEVSTKESV